MILARWLTTIQIPRFHSCQRRRPSLGLFGRGGVFDGFSTVTIINTPQADDTFNTTLAQSAGGLESVLVPSASQTGSSTGTTGGVSGTGAPAPSSGGGSNAGAIAGGVVGGIVFLALVGLAVFFFLRRRKAKQVPPSAAYAAAPYQNPSSPPPMSYGDGTSTYATIPTPKPYVRFFHPVAESVLILFCYLTGSSRPFDLP